MSTTTIVSTAAAGILAGVIGIRTVFLAGGVVCLLAAGVSWLLFRADRAKATAPATGSGDSVSVGPPSVSAVEV